MVLHWVPPFSYVLRKISSLSASHTDLSLGKHSHEPLPVFGEGDHRGGSPRPLGILNHFRNLALHHCHTRVGGPKINPNYCPLHLRTAWKDRGKSCDEYRSTDSKCRLIPGPSSTFWSRTVGTCRAGNYTGVSIDKQQECCGNLVVNSLSLHQLLPPQSQTQTWSKEGLLSPSQLTSCINTSLQLCSNIQELTTIIQGADMAIMAFQSPQCILTTLT